MAGTVTLKDGKPNRNARIIAVTASLTSDGSGDASDTTSATYTGMLMGVMVNPGATAPTDNWDLTLNNADGVDLLGGNGANLDTANSEWRPSLVSNAVDTTNLLAFVPLDDTTLNFVGANMGASKVAVVKALILLVV